MKKLMLAMAALIPAAALADEAQPEPAPVSVSKTELTMADLPNNAFTNPARTFVLHPLLPSAYSVTDDIELKTGLTGLVLGNPGFSAEFRVLNGPDLAISIEPSVAALWVLSAFQVGGTGRVTLKMGSNYLGASVGWIGAVNGIVRDPATGEIVRPAGMGASVPVVLNWNLQTSSQTIWEVYATANVMSLISTNRNGIVGFNWYHSFGGSFQLGLGLYAYVGGVPSDVADTLTRLFNVHPLRIAVLPFPDATLGWKF